MRNSPLVIAADIGGSHITVAAVDTSTWQVVNDSVVRSKVDSHADAESILTTWALPFREAISRQVATDSTITIGIAIPGPFDYENGISRMRNQDKYDHLYGMDIRQELAERIGVNGSDIHFINDAAAFLQGEISAGNQDSTGKILGITLGTGLGSAVWEPDGNAVDADLWKTPYRESIMEEYLATRWFVRQAAQHGITVSGLRELLELRDKHTVIEDILAGYSHHLLHFIRLFSEQEGTDKLIIGGNISKAWEVFRTFDSTAFGRFDIRISRLGEHAALIGAAAQHI